MGAVLSGIGRALLLVLQVVVFAATRVLALAGILFLLALPLLLLFLVAQIFLVIQINYRPIAVAVNVTLEATELAVNSVGASMNGLSQIVAGIAPGWNPLIDIVLSFGQKDSGGPVAVLFKVLFIQIGCAIQCAFVPASCDVHSAPIPQLPRRRSLDADAIVEPGAGAAPWDVLASRACARTPALCDFATLACLAAEATNASAPPWPACGVLARTHPIDAGLGTCALGLPGRNASHVGACAGDLVAR
jgi:hypothetical protein